MLPHKHWWCSRRSRPEGRDKIGITNPVPQVAAPPRTHTRMVIKTSPGIPDPAKIAEVDGFRRDPETPQHDECSSGVVSIHAQPFGRSREREEREVEEAVHQGEEKRHEDNCLCVLTLPRALLYIVGRGTLPLHQGTRRRPRGEARATTAKGGGAKPPPPTLTLALAG
jgi:hypothetical protein